MQAFKYVLVLEALTRRNTVSFMPLSARKKNMVRKNT